MTKEKIKDIAIRTAKTFIQGFIGALVVILPNSDYTDEAFLKSALIGALAGGICAVMNAIMKALQPEEQTTFNIEITGEEAPEEPEEE